MSSKAKLRSKHAHDGPEPFSGLVMRSQSRYTGASSAALTHLADQKSEAQAAQVTY